jgi:hypothetical protein
MKKIKKINKRHLRKHVGEKKEQRKSITQKYKFMIVLTYFFFHIIHKNNKITNNNNNSQYFCCFNKITSCDKFSKAIKMMIVVACDGKLYSV